MDGVIVLTVCNTNYNMCNERMVLQVDYLLGVERFLIGKDKSLNTVSCYVRDTRSFINWFEGDTATVSEYDAVSFKKHLQKDCKEIITVNRKIASVNSFLNWLHESDHIGQRIKIPTINIKDKPEFKGVEVADIKRLRREVHRSGNKLHVCIFEVLLGTGIRVSELINIRLQDIKITDRKGWIEVIGKGNAMRSVPINKDVRKAIEDYIEVRPNRGGEYLTVGQRENLKRNAVNLILEKYGVKLEIEVTPHIFRHSFGYKLVSEGTAITTIKDLLGHKDIKTTLIYTQTTRVDMQNAVEELEW